MSLPSYRHPRRVLIASSHPLFGQGLRSLLIKRQAADVEVVGMVSNLSEALAALEQLDPDLIIVDYDDKALNREEFLARFVEGEKKLRVVLLSLQSGGEALVYDRRSLAASQIDNWLEEWNYGEESDEEPAGASDRHGWLQTKVGRIADMKHLVIAGILVVVVTVALIFALGDASFLLPVRASAQAVTIDKLFRLEFRVIAFLFSLIVVLMVYSIIVFRRKKGDLSDSVHIEGNNRLEVLWTLAPLATVLVFAYLGGQSLGETLTPDPKPLEVNVIGQQWSWRFEYPTLGITTSELMLPAKKQALLHLSSQDVIHSFWVPEFRVKQDALPGGKEFVRDLRVTPTIVGQYNLVCAELCGRQHSTMIAKVNVMEPGEFDSWVAEQTAASNDPVARGQKLAKDFGCVACHSIDGTRIVGPTWKGVYGSTETFTDGTSATVDDAYLHESIVNPAAKIVQGYQNLMPATFGTQLTEEQIADIIAFIKSLK